MATRKRKKAATKPVRATKPTRKRARAKAREPRSRQKSAKEKPGSAVTPTRAAQRTPRAVKASPKKPAKVKRPKPSKPAKRRLAKRKPARPVPKPRPQAKRPAQRKRRGLSRHPEAVRSRKRRREIKGVIDAKRAERTEARERTSKQKRGQVDERTLAIGWLETIRNHIAGVFPVSLEITEAETGARTPWLVVGRYDPREDVGYQTLAEAFEFVRDDVLLEATIHPQRLSQIRITYADPRAKRGEGDSIVSKIGAWEFIISDLIGELVGGGGGEDGTPDADSLAGRYDETTVPVFYIYFSSEIVEYRTAFPSKTQNVSMR